MTTFALVHGAWWWERLAPLLRGAGHVVTMDLPSDDGSATFDTYADVVPVGRSYGAAVLFAHRTPLCATTYIVCRDDQILRPEWSRQSLKTDCAALIELPGGHSPYHSRPSALAGALLAVTTATGPRRGTDEVTTNICELPQKSANLNALPLTNRLSFEDQYRSP